MNRVIKTMWKHIVKPKACSNIRLLTQYIVNLPFKRLVYFMPFWSTEITITRCNSGRIMVFYFIMFFSVFFFGLNVVMMNYEFFNFGPCENRIELLLFKKKLSLKVNSQIWFSLFAYEMLFLIRNPSST